MSALGGRHAIVTGANRGIGAAAVRALSAQGANVSLLVRDRARGEETARRVPGPHVVVVADITDRVAVQDACAEAATRLGPIDSRVNNAGSTESAPFLKTDPALFTRLIAEHLSGAVHATQAVLPGMIERGGGHVVNVASVAGLRGEAYVSAYVAAKHALVGLTRALAVEMFRHGVAVNAVCPGYTDTELVRDSVNRVSAKTGMSNDEALRAILSRAGQSRLVTVDEVAAAIVALCVATPGEEAQTVVVDGSAR